MFREVAKQRSGARSCVETAGWQGSGDWPHTQIGGTHHPCLPCPARPQYGSRMRWCGEARGSRGRSTAGRGRGASGEPSWAGVQASPGCRDQVVARGGRQDLGCDARPAAVPITRAGRQQIVPDRCRGAPHPDVPATSSGPVPGGGTGPLDGSSWVPLTELRTSLSKSAGRSLAVHISCSRWWSRSPRRRSSCRPGASSCRKSCTAARRWRFR
jgi:hypothetical protein